MNRERSLFQENTGRNHQDYWRRSGEGNCSLLYREPYSVWDRKYQGNLPVDWGRIFKSGAVIIKRLWNKNQSSKKELQECIDRASLLLKDDAKKPIILNIEENILSLEAASNMGSMNESMFVVKEGEKLRIGFNPNFIRDAASDWWWGSLHVFYECKNAMYCKRWKRQLCISGSSGQP